MGGLIRLLHKIAGQECRNGYFNMDKAWRPMKRAAHTWSLFVVLLALGAICHGQQASATDDGLSSAALRSGTVSLRTPDAPEVLATGSSVVAKSAAVGTAASASNVKDLYLIKYPSLASALKIRDNLLARGGHIESHIPADQLLVVSAKGADVADIATRFDGKIAQYASELKVSPELRSAVGSVEQQNRRRLAEVEDDVTAAGSTPTLGSFRTWDARMQAAADRIDGVTPETRRRLQQQASDAPSEPLYGVHVHLAKGLSRAERTAFYRQLPAALGSLQPKILAGGLYHEHVPSLQVYLRATDIAEGISRLSSRPEAVWVAPVLRMVTNNAAAGWLIQTGDIDATHFKNLTGELRPYWKAGLRGEGQIVGVSDSGIDMRSCYFIDDKYNPANMTSQFKPGFLPVPLSSWLSPASEGALRLYMPDHRKVVQYVMGPSLNISAFGDDTRIGHGTHVCGSVAGARPSHSDLGFENDVATGSAPMARLSFVDVGAGNTTQLSIDTPVNGVHLAYHNAVGADISSDSWGNDGAAGVTYDFLSIEYDIFAWTTPNHLSFVAAGNGGLNTYQATVSSPATAKNIIAVGASVNHPPGSVTGNFFDLAQLQFRYTDSDNITHKTPVFPSFTGSSGGAWVKALANTAVPIVVASPIGACQKIQNLSSSPSIVIVDLGQADCSYATVVKNVNNSGAVGVYYIRPDDLYVTENLPGKPSTWEKQTVVYFLLNKALGRWMLNTIANSSNSGFRMAFSAYPEVDFGTEALAYFSSTGPYPAGFIKPEIVAPGFLVLSARSVNHQTSSTDSETCSTDKVQMAGTSMSAPLAAGHAALLRQYFTDGYYPAGSVSAYESTAFTPTGMAMKAAIISGARSMAGGYNWAKGERIGSAPNGDQGWGRMDLSGALPVPGITSPEMRIQVADRGTIKQDDVIRLEGLRATGTGAITATLVWYDFPGPVMSDSFLYNDLDFKYTINNGEVLTYREDHTNNVERIELSGLKAGDNLTFLVQGTRVVHELEVGELSQLPQRWSVVVVGHFTGSLKTNLNPSYATPQRIKPASSKDTSASLNTYQAVVKLADGHSCLSSTGRALTVAASCSSTDKTSVFSLIEKKDAATGGIVYVVKDFTSRCWTLSSTNTLGLSSCNGGSSQLFAAFKNPHAAGPIFSIVPRTTLGSSTAPRLCLTAPDSVGSAGLNLVACDEDSAAQAFSITIQAAQLAPVVPPSPAPPPPSPSPPPSKLPEPWLRFAMVWLPADPNSRLQTELQPRLFWYSDFYGSEVSIRANGTKVSVQGGSFRPGGSGANYDEIVFADPMFKPDQAVYRLCATWNSTKSTGTYNILATAFINGSQVATFSKTWDTSLPQDPDSCNASTAGYMGSVRYPPYSPPQLPPPAPSPPRSPPKSRSPRLPPSPRPPRSPSRSKSPPPSPAPPPKPPVAPYMPWLLFRTAWSSQNDLDIFVTWKVGTTNYIVTFNSTTARGGAYGGDNMRINPPTNYETVAWSDVAQQPDAAEYSVCVKWWDVGPAYNVTLTAALGSSSPESWAPVPVLQVSKSWDSSLPLDWRCTNTSNGYMGSFTYEPISVAQPPPPQKQAHPV